MTLDEVYDYLGPKPADCCYAFIFNKIEEGYFYSIKQVKNFLRRVIKNDKSIRDSFVFRFLGSSYFERNESWVEQAKEILLFIEGDK